MYDCPMQFHIFILLLCFSSLCCFSLYGSDDLLHVPFTIQLEAPEYEAGVISTQQGGVIQGQGFRLQGRCITYTKKHEAGKEIHTVSATGDLMLNYQGQIFIGDDIEYDFTTHTGYVLNGRTCIDVWLISGTKILLHPDSSFEVMDASITTSEDEQVVWSMNAHQVHLTPDKYLITQNIQFKCLNFPILWIPSFKGYLRSNNDSAIKYALSWDAGQGPKISLRYRVYSWKQLNLYLRADYRYARGPGGAFEIDYTSLDQATLWQSKNYIAHDTFYNDDRPNRKRTRFRLQGVYSTHSQNEKAHLDVVYDKISDKNMPGDFPADDFELTAAQETRIRARYLGDQMITGFNLKPRINHFDGFKQELPSFSMNIKALKLHPTPLVFDNQLKLSYLDYVYSNQLVNMPPNIAAVLKDFHSVRAETHQELSLPLSYQGLHFTPRTGIRGIAYNKSPDHHSIYQLVLTYGADLNASWTKSLHSYVHTVTPYVQYIGVEKPLKSYRRVYIFDINDAYHRLNMLRIGLKQLLYHSVINPFLPTLACDLYALGFLADQTFRIPFPKAGINFSWNQPNLVMTSDIRWNFNNHVLDFANLALHYTINASIAMNIEFRHRSRFDWRKDNHQDFTLDVTQSIHSLVDSPISDGRNVLLTKAEFKVTPKWTCRVEMHNGWGRRDQPGYTEAKLDLLGLVSSAWRLKLSYMYTTRGTSHFGVGLDLIK
jgi:hypothetical protein